MKTCLTLSILLYLLLIIGCNNISNPIVSREINNNSIQTRIERIWPSLVPTLTPVISTDSNNVRSSMVYPPTLANHKIPNEPFVYLKWDSPYRNWILGDCYYVDTKGGQTLIWGDGYGCTTISLNGDFVYFIKIISIDFNYIPFKITDQPIRYNIKTKQYTELAPARTSSDDWAIAPYNYLLSSSTESNMYFIGAISFALTGEFWIYKNDSIIYHKTNESFLQPDILANTLVCGRKIGSGNYKVELHQLNLTNWSWSVLHPEPNPTDEEFYECNFGHIGNNIIGFTEFHYLYPDGGWDMKPYIIKNGETIPLPMFNQRWANGISINRGKYGINFITYPIANPILNNNYNALYSYNDGETLLLDEFNHKYAGEINFCNSEFGFCTNVRWDYDNCILRKYNILNANYRDLFNPNGLVFFIGTDKNKPNSI